MKIKPIFSTELIFRMAHELRKQGKVVGLTHGAFDLFHSSHLDFLLKSAKLCDFLIVGVDCDETIGMYKSYKRPIITQNSRLEIVNELNCVDATFVKEKEFFDSTSMQDLYKEIKPDFITIGENYGSDKITYDTSKVHIPLKKLEVEQNYTSTKIINKIIQLYSKHD